MALLAAMLERLTEKPKPLTYLETHSGRALYDLSSAEALKTGEAAAGVGALAGRLPADHPFVKVLTRGAGRSWGYGLSRLAADRRGDAARG